MINSNDIKFSTSFINKLPNNLLAIYGYGSGFYKQSGNNETQYDLLLFYDEEKTSAIEWLKEFNELQPSFFPESIKKILLNKKSIPSWGPNCIVIPFVPYCNQYFKLVLVPYNESIKNLNDWNQNLCIPHRLGKASYPFLTNSETLKSIQENQRYFLIISLALMNQKSFSMYDLFHQYCELSYTRDIRTFLHLESADKIEKKVMSDAHALLKICERNQDLLKVENELFVKENWDIRELKLPDNLSCLLNRNNDWSSNLELQKLLLKYIKYKNLEYSLPLSLKQVYINGLKNSSAYILEKAKKSFHI